MRFSQGHAVLIGVGAYAHEPRLDVPVTATDAAALATVLRDQQLCGYPAEQITLLCDAQATRDGVLAALRGLAAHVAEEDTVVLFYSGHGHYLEDGSYCLTTHDTRFTRGQRVAAGTAVGHQELLDELRAVCARRVLLIFNACHAGAISPTLGGDQPDDAVFVGQSPPDPTTAALLATGEGRAIITACRERQYAFVGPGPHTIFTQALLDGLRGAGVSSQQGYVSVFDLYTHLYSAVGAAVRRQVPDTVRQRYGGAQEPELTILKGVGPFAVALHQGAATLGAFEPAPAPPPAGAVRSIDQAFSQAMLEQIQGGVQIGAGARVTAHGSIVGRDQRTTYDNRQASISVGTADGVVVAFNDGTINYSRAGPAAPADPLDNALALVRQQVALARQQGDGDLEADLQGVAQSIEAALKAQRDGKADRRAAKLRAAQEEIARLADDRPALRAVASALGSG